MKGGIKRGMIDHYINSIQNNKKGNMDVYKETLIDVVGKEITWTEVKQLDSTNLIKIMCLLDEKIKLKNSPINVIKLARAIQNSRSGIGLSAMTNFNCAFCGITEMWGSSAVPKICLGCATKMAENMAKYSFDVFK
jgi:hypothetical protein